MNWKHLFDVSQNAVLGLDIGSSAVKAVQLRKNQNGYVVTAAGVADIEITGNEENSLVTNTTGAICGSYKLSGAKTRFAVCGVSGPEVAVRCFQFPELLPGEIAGAVLLEASQVCPFNINECEVDYQLIPGGNGNVKGVLVAATQKIIKGKKQLVKDASLDCVLMDVDGLALLNCFMELEKPEPDKAAAVVNVGSSLTNLVIIGSDGLPFIRDITFGGSNIIRQIADEMNISEKAVAKALHGVGDVGPNQQGLEDSFKKACQRLIVDVSETLRYYATQDKSTAVTKLYVCGGGALFRGFTDLLSGQIGASVVLWNPFEKMQCDADKNCQDMLAVRGPELAVAAGLAMRTI